MQLPLSARKSFTQRLGFLFFRVSEEESSKLSCHGDHQSAEDHDPAHCTIHPFPPFLYYLLLGFMFFFILLLNFSPCLFVLYWFLFSLMLYHSTFRGSSAPESDIQVSPKRKSCAFVHSHLWGICWFWCSFVGFFFASPWVFPFLFMFFHGINSVFFVYFLAPCRKLEFRFGCLSRKIWELKAES